MTNHQSFFDPYEWRSCYFAKMDRDEATQLLSDPLVEVGTFLLRGTTRAGSSYSLSVRESSDASQPKAVRHYLIADAVDEDLNKVVKIGDQSFQDIPSLLNYYKIRLLENCSLTMPYRERATTKVMGLWKFAGETDDDLAFAAGEELDILGKEGEGWLRARNAIGREGVVPENFVGPPDFECTTSSGVQLREIREDEKRNSADLSKMRPYSSTDVNLETPLPSWGRVLFDFYANAYNERQVSLKKGCIVRVDKVYSSGWAEGRVLGEKTKMGENGEEETDQVDSNENHTLHLSTVREEILPRSCYFTDTSKTREGIFPIVAIEFGKDHKGTAEVKTRRKSDWGDTSSIGSVDSFEEEFNKRQSQNDGGVFEMGLFHGSWM